MTIPRLGVIAVSLLLAALAPATPHRHAFASNMSVSTEYLAGISGAVTICQINNANIDSLLREEFPDTNHGTNGSLVVATQTNKLFRSLVQFSLSSCSIPSTADVLTARFELYLFSAPSASRTLALTRVTSNWTEGGVTWNNQPSGTGAIYATTTGTTDNVWVKWEATSIVQDWVDGSAPNGGFRVVDGAEGTIQQFASQFRSSEFSGSSFRSKLTAVWMP